MKRRIFAITSILISSASIACESSHEPVDAIQPSLLQGMWYFDMGSYGNLKLDLRADQTFEVSVISKAGEEERKPGGTWAVNGQSFVLMWPDGESKVEQVLSVGPCELRAQVSGGGIEVYQRKPVQ